MDSTKLQVYEADLESKPQDVHFLPFRIDYDGPAKVNSYFIVENLTTRDAQADPKTLVAAFRGRRLLGEKLELPAGSSGYLINENIDFDEEGEGSDMDQVEESQGRRILQVQGRFESVTHWDQDAIPSRIDGVVPKWLSIIELTRAIHGHDDVHII